MVAPSSLRTVKRVPSARIAAWLDAGYGANKIIVFNAEHQRMTGKHSAVELGKRHIDQPGIGGQRRFAVDFPHQTTRGIGLGNYQPFSGGMKMLVFEHRKRQRGEAEGEHGGVLQQPAVVIDKGLFEMEHVAGGTADDRDVAQGPVERSGEQFFAARQTVGQEQTKGLETGGLQPLLNVGGDAFHLGRHGGERMDQIRDGLKIIACQGGAADSAALETQRRQLTGGGAADQRAGQMQA